MLLYDHFIANGGAEKVSFEIAEALNCPIKTAWASAELFSQQMNSGILQSDGVDYINALFPTLKLLRYYQNQCQVPSQAPFVIASGVFSPLCLPRVKNRKKLVYFHTFPSFTQSDFAQLKAAHGFLGAAVFKTLSWWYGKCLKAALGHADGVYSNSVNVQQKFRCLLNIDSEVLYPPVVLEGLGPDEDKGYYLSTARLEANKRVDRVLAVFAKLPQLNLVVAGGGSLMNDYRQQYKDCSNIRFLGWQQPQELKHYYRHCRALVHLAEEEYFGIAPVEAMACGKPVIGVAEGGLLETVSDPRCGILLRRDFTLADVAQAITTIEQSAVGSEVVAFRLEQAQRFGAAHFYQRLKSCLHGES